MEDARTGGRGANPQVQRFNPPPPPPAAALFRPPQKTDPGKQPHLLATASVPPTTWGVTADEPAGPDLPPAFPPGATRLRAPAAADDAAAAESSSARRSGRAAGARTRRAHGGAGAVAISVLLLTCCSGYCADVRTLLPARTERVPHVSLPDASAVRCAAWTRHGLHRGRLVGWEEVLYTGRVRNATGQAGCTVHAPVTGTAANEGRREGRGGGVVNQDDKTGVTANVKCLIASVRSASYGKTNE
jgi:hypothetical protein